VRKWGTHAKKSRCRWAPLLERPGLNQAGPWIVLGRWRRLGGGLRRDAESSRIAVGLLVPFLALVVVLVLR
jgi:hypothetical protein